MRDVKLFLRLKVKFFASFIATVRGFTGGAMHSTEGHTRVPVRQEIWLRFHLSLFSLHFAATLAEKRIKSGNEGRKVSGSFLPRQSLSTGSFVFCSWNSWWTYECETLSRKSATCQSLCERNPLALLAETIVSIYVKKKSTFFSIQGFDVETIVRIAKCC